MDSAVVFVISFVLGSLSTYLFFRNKSQPKQQNAQLQDQQKRSEPSKNDKKEDSESDSSEEDGEPTENYKLVLVVRNDLKMEKGKVAAQCSHATLGAYKICIKKFRENLKKWEKSGQAKIVLRVETESAMNALEESAKAAALPTHVVVDAGRTQIASGSRTVLAIGPAEAKSIDQVTGKLKLY
eukprot:TRINITY_DN3737_c0_g3_i2.p1 TRINITY_DN3737_c0_g3~~TRINITY_DN3737_c0_g3_i2.p1  ORF type:complete len:183 (-),score=44.39 TRINITY_DN3737_c0_g3_i2:77-625(-)